MSSIDNIWEWNGTVTFMVRGSTSALDLGVRVRLRREALGLTQGEVAERAGVTRQLVSRIEHGHPRAELAGVVAVIRALHAEIVLADVAESASTDLDSFFED